MKPNYLGQKGYSIYKKNLSIEQQNDLRRELMVQAKVPNSPVKTEPFPIYLESTEKIYVPRYFGYKKFGTCDIKIEDGEDIDLSFNGTLGSCPGLSGSLRVTFGNSHNTAIDNVLATLGGQRTTF
mgnify:CR=1 FL=1